MKESDSPRYATPAPRRRRKKQAASRLGLWIGLGAGGAVLLILVIVLVIVLASNSSTSNGSGSSLSEAKQFIGRWEREGDKNAPLKTLEFTEEGHFRQIMPDGKPLTFGTYEVKGKRMTIEIGPRSRIGINGRDIRQLEATLLSANELQLKYLDVVARYRKVN
jgi:hypothetical protein